MRRGGERRSDGCGHRGGSRIRANAGVGNNQFGLLLTRRHIGEVAVGGGGSGRRRRGLHAHVLLGLLLLLLLKLLLLLLLLQLLHMVEGGGGDGLRPDHAVPGEREPVEATGGEQVVVEAKQLLRGRRAGRAAASPALLEGVCSDRNRSCRGGAPERRQRGPRFRGEQPAVASAAVKVGQRGPGLGDDAAAVVDQRR